MSAVALAQRSLTVNVELDDRSFLFPAGKPLSHLMIHVDEAGLVRLDAVFQFNESRQPAEIAALGEDDARDFARALIDAVYQGRTQHVLSDEARLAVIFNPNGFVLKFGEERALRELFVNSPAIIRIAQGIMRVVDRLAAALPH
ncbi:hypothetical protein [Azospirillum sp. TSO22-1]|uniref:hypothetical protein n=1 Tax=Azospirillum sp. TSO22-1 TaxID=716789 RepID=UPI000D60BB10|nr:hypothetical protein [Azospirillum sp. TSO22-1]PWC35722.1 hypothetical protein TSO221_29035 [Azospirillum sp. TSO22-1]